MQVVHTDNAPAAKGPYSQGRKANGIFFVSGQGPVDPASGEFILGTFEEQTRLTLNNLKTIIEAGGASLADVLKVNVYLQNLDDFAELNRIYAEFFPAPYPARTTVGCELLGFLVEIDCMVADNS